MSGGSQGEGGNGGAERGSSLESFLEASRRDVTIEELMGGTVSGIGRGASPGRTVLDEREREAFEWDSGGDGSRSHEGTSVAGRTGAAFEDRVSGSGAFDDGSTGAPVGGGRALPTEPVATQGSESALGGDQRARLYTVPAGVERRAVDALLRAPAVTWATLTGDDLSTMWRIARWETSAERCRVWLLSCRGALLTGEVRDGDTVERLRLHEGEEAQRRTRQEVFAAWGGSAVPESWRAWIEAEARAGGGWHRVEEALRVPGVELEESRWYDSAGLDSGAGLEAEPGDSFPVRLLLSAGCIVSLDVEETDDEAVVRRAELLHGEAAWEAWRDALERSWSGESSESDVAVVETVEDAMLRALAYDHYWFELQAPTAGAGAVRRLVCRDYLDGEAVAVDPGGADSRLDAWKLAQLVERVSREEYDDAVYGPNGLGDVRAERVRLALVALERLGPCFDRETGRLREDTVDAAWARGELRRKPGLYTQTSMAEARARLTGDAVDSLPADSPHGELVRWWAGTEGGPLLPVVRHTKARPPSTILGSVFLALLVGVPLAYFLPEQSWVEPGVVGFFAVRHLLLVRRWRSTASSRERKLRLDEDGIALVDNEGREDRRWSWHGPVVLEVFPGVGGAPEGADSVAFAAVIRDANRAEVAADVLMMMLDARVPVAEIERRGIDRSHLRRSVDPMRSEAAKRLGMQMVLHGAWLVPPATFWAVWDHFRKQPAEGRATGEAVGRRVGG